MPKTTPFHERLQSFNQTKIWKNWSGYLVAPKYQYSKTVEYYAIRNAVALLDTTPLFKYRIVGADAEAFLQRVMARDIRKCKQGEAQYTAWCNEAGFVLQDGVVMHVAENDYWLTAAEPTLRYFRMIARNMGLDNVTIEDLSTDYGILALQGPRAYEVLKQLTNDIGSLKYFDVTTSTVAGKRVVISRTGFTGDLGYEIWVRSEDGLAVFDSLLAAGKGHNITPLGTTALKMARMEAGLLLMDVDFHSARYAWVDEQRETLCELGWNWMLRGLKKDDRDFIGRRAVEAELNSKSNRWTTVGLEIDWHDYERVHLEAGITAPKHNVYREATHSIYRRNEKEWDYAGYATSFTFSSLLKKPIALAKLPLDLAKVGTEVDLEISVIRKPVNVLARVHKLPFFNPARKTAIMNEGSQ